jgi:hypothetical protein
MHVTLTSLLRVLQKYSRFTLLHQIIKLCKQLFHRLLTGSPEKKRALLTYILSKLRDHNTGNVVLTVFFSIAEMKELSNLKEERFVLSHNFRGFSP